MTDALIVGSMDDLYFNWIAPGAQYNLPCLQLQDVSPKNLTGNMYRWMTYRALPSQLTMGCLTNNDDGSAQSTTDLALSYIGYPHTLLVQSAEVISSYPSNSFSAQVIGCKVSHEVYMAEDTNTFTRIIWDVVLMRSTSGS